MKCFERKYRISLTKREQAAVLRVYLGKRLPARETAKWLGLDRYLVSRFLRARGVLGRRGNPGVPRKLSVVDRQKLISELATTIDGVLARKYGVSRERVRQIRQQFGYRSSRILRRRQMARARAEREKQERRTKELRRQQRRARRLLAINQLSKRWKSGALASVLAKEFGICLATMQTRIDRSRKEFPGKFPFRNRRRSPRLSGATVVRKL